MDTSSDWIHVGSASVVSRKGSRFHTTVKGRYVSVIRTSREEIFCIDAVCYHAGGPLTLGDIEDIDGDACVKCPWHHYAIRLDDGKKLSQGLDIVNGVMVPTGWQATSESLQRTHRVKIEKDELFICLSNEDGKDRHCRSDSYAYNKAAGQQVLGRVDTRAGSDGVMRSRVPSGKVFNKGKRTTTRKTGSLMFRVESTPEKKKSEIVEEEDSDEEMDVDFGAARSRRVALEPGFSDMDWARIQRKTPQVYDGKRKITTSELARHRSRDDLWIAIRGKVYDVTKYLPYHPGGVEEVIRGAGQDATLLFNEVHRWIQASQMLSKYCVGTFVRPEDEENKDNVISANEKWYSFDVIRIKRVANRTNLITVRYDKGKWPLGESIRCGMHVHVTVRSSKSSPTLRPYRAYTPVDVREDEAEIDFVIKMYDDGKLTRILKDLRPRDEVMIRGPRGNIHYKGNGVFRLVSSSSMRTFKSINMIAGGTGLTPMLQILRQVYNHDDDTKTHFRLIYCVRNSDDIILIDEMVRLDKNDRIDVIIVLTGKDVPKDWPGISGKMNEALIRKYALEASSSDTFNLLCGPPGFVSSARKSLLKSGHDVNSLYEF